MFRSFTRSGERPSAPSARPAASAAAMLATTVFALAPLPPAQAQSLAEFQQLATELIATHSSQLEGQLSVTLAAPRLEQRRPCTDGLSAFLPGGARLRPRMNIGFRCEGPQHWSLYAQAEIAVNGSYLVASAPIKNGENLDRSKVQQREGNLLQQPADVLTQWEQLARQQARQRIAAGQPIRAGALRDTESVLRGSTVKLVIEGQGFSVSTEGVAMEDAAPGQAIQVRNPAGALLSGRVRNAGTVEILY